MAGRPVELTKPGGPGRRANVLWWNAKKMCQGQRPPFRWCRRRLWGGETSSAIGTKELSDVWDARGAALHPLVRCRLQDPSEPQHMTCQHPSYQKIFIDIITSNLIPHPNIHHFEMWRWVALWWWKFVWLSWVWWASLSSLIHLSRQGVFSAFPMSCHVAHATKTIHDLCRSTIGLYWQHGVYLHVVRKCRN